MRSGRTTARKEVALGAGCRGGVPRKDSPAEPASRRKDRGSSANEMSADRANSATPLS
jgi:hypothetical protein